MAQEVSLDKSGTNIVQKIDISQLSSEFLQFFYNTWKTNPQTFVESGLFYDYSRLSFDGTIYKGIDIVTFMNSVWYQSNLSFDIKKFNCMDSGSRRIDILVNGFINKQGTQYPFTQYFMVAHVKDSWKLHNSIINIFI